MAQEQMIKYLVQTRSQAKSSRVSLPEVHGIGKGLDPHVRPENQNPISSSHDVRPPCLQGAR